MKVPATEQPVSSPGLLSPLTRADYLLCGLLSLAIVLISVHRSGLHLLWPDELLSYRLLQAPTLRAMLRGWHDGADGGGLLFYLLARLWTSCFGLSALALRLFSTAGMLLGLFWIWCLARRSAPTVVVSFAVAIVYLVPVEFLWQASDARFYGLFFAAAALCALLFRVTASGSPTRLLLLATAIAHTLLVGSHILGFLYSIALALGMLCLGPWRRQWPLVASAAVGWLLVPLSWHAIRASSSIEVKPFEAPAPKLDDLITGATLSDPVATGVLALLLALFLLTPWIPALKQLARRSPSLPRDARVLILVNLAAMLALFLLSQIQAPVFRDRYLFPVSIASVLLIASLTARILPPSIRAPRSAAATLLVSVAILLPGLVFGALRDMKEIVYPPSSFVAAAVALPPLPIVVTHFPAFNVLEHYDQTHRYLYLLNWTYDLAPSRKHAPYPSERLMENVRRSGFLEDQILSCEAIFSTYPDVILLTEPRRSAWLQDRLLHNPDLRVLPISFPAWRGVSAWSVHRLRPAPTPCSAPTQP